MDNKENDQYNVTMATEEASSPAIASSQSPMDTLLVKIQRIATDVSKIREDMATKEELSKIREEMTNIQDTMATQTQKLDRLLVATPAAAIPDGDFVLSPPRGDFAAPYTGRSVDVFAGETLLE